MDNVIIERLEALQSYYTATRRCGHTTAMIDGAKKCLEAVILAVNKSHVFQLKQLLPESECISLHNLQALRGCRKPLLVDNCTMSMLLADAIYEIRRLEKLVDKMKWQQIEIQRLEKLVDKMKWHPIETAPTDGTLILVGIAGIANSVYEVQWWQDEDGRSGWETVDRVKYMTPPTHWMPFPSIPNIESETVITATAGDGGGGGGGTIVSGISFDDIYGHGEGGGGEAKMLFADKPKSSKQKVKIKQIIVDPHRSGILGLGSDGAVYDFGGKGWEVYLPAKFNDETRTTRMAMTNE